MNKFLRLLAVPLVAAGCSDMDTASTQDDPLAAAPPPAAEPMAVTAPRPRAAGASADAQEYRHRAEVSRFRVGANPRSVASPQWSKVIGDEGVFAADLITGFTRGNPNGDAPASRVAALSRDPEVHNARVLRYFAEAGLPGAEVRGAHVTTMMKGAHRASEPAPAPEFVAYTSIVDRAVEGITVAESFAWARFNRDDDVMAEAVYWPRIPGAVIDDAKALRAIDADPEARARYRARIGVEDAPAQIRIHHTNGAARSGWLAFASYDVSVKPAAGVRGRSDVQRHFDVDGNERDVPSR
jgi:hypothetical protein